MSGGACALAISSADKSSGQEDWADRISSRRQMHAMRSAAVIADPKAIALIPSFTAFSGVGLTAGLHCANSFLIHDGVKGWTRVH